MDLKVLNTIPSIIISGTVGKTITLRYLNFLLCNYLKLKTLYFEVDSKNKLIFVLLNGIEIVDLEIYRYGFEFVGLDLAEEHQPEAILLHEIAKEHRIDMIIGKHSVLTKYLKLVGCGLTILDYDRYMNSDVTLEKNIGNEFLRPNVPLVVCPQTKEYGYEIFTTCVSLKVPLFCANFFHLKYVNYNAQLKARYVYLNLGLAMTIYEIYRRSFDLKGNYVPFQMQKFKSIDSDYGKILHVNPPSPLPQIKNIYFPEYSRFIEYSKSPNLKLFLEPAGTYKSSNILAAQFESKIEFDRGNDETKRQIIPILLFSCLPETELVLTSLPLSTINFETIFVIDQKLKGWSFEDILEVFKNNELSHFFHSDDHDWTQTTYEILNHIYNDSEIQEKRKLSRSPLNEYMGLIEDISKCDFNNLPKNPTINIDTLDYVKKWITRLASKYPNANYYVLITGCKKLVYDALKAFDVSP